MPTRSSWCASCSPQGGMPRSNQCRPRHLVDEVAQRQLATAATARFLHARQQAIDRWHGNVARREMPAALVACDIEYLVHADAAGVARRYELVVLGHDHKPRTLERAGHMRHSDTREPELVGETVDAPQPPAGDVCAPDEVHELEREL